MKNLTKHHPFSVSAFLTLLLAFWLGWLLSSYYHQPFVKDTAVGSVMNNPSFSSSSSVSSSDLSSKAENKIDLGNFWKVWEVINDNYVRPEELINEERVYGAIRGMVNAIGDAYTAFLDPQQSNSLNMSLTGEFEGVGMELTTEKGLLTVVSPLKDSPAELAGVKPGDVVYEIDGKPAAEMSVFDAIMAIRGPKGTTVHLTLLRKDEDEPIEVNIVRERIELDSVTFEMKEDKIAYISINQFDESTTDELHKAVTNVLLSDPKGLILDLRFNGGGILDTAVDILSEFIEGERPAVIIRKRDPAFDQTVFTDGSARLPSIPLVVLVNEGSASASEIVAGAIQDHKRGFVMGTQTFGKGSVQEVFQLEDKSTLRVTIALWYTPNNTSIEDVGITPDRVVEDVRQKEKEKEKEKDDVDEQLEEAIKYLKDL